MENKKVVDLLERVSNEFANNMTSENVDLLNEVTDTIKELRSEGIKETFKNFVYGNDSAYNVKKCIEENNIVDFVYHISYSTKEAKQYVNENFSDIKNIMEVVLTMFDSINIDAVKKYMDEEYSYNKSIVDTYENLTEDNKIVFCQKLTDTIIKDGKKYGHPYKSIKDMYSSDRNDLIEKVYEEEMLESEVPFPDKEENNEE